MREESTTPPGERTAGPPSDPPLLAVEGLSVEFLTPRGWFRVVDDLSFTVDRGETLAIVGESGSGKSVTSLAMMRLIKTPPGRIVGGTVAVSGTDVMSLPMRDVRDLRGDRIGMVFQEPMTSLNPAFTIGDQISEVVRRHRSISRKAATARAVEVLDQVGISRAAERVGAYPHEFSGGMRQRVMIAMAVACEPELLIADEPTTALDVTVQAQVLDLLLQMKEALGMGLIVITHDFGVVADVADRVMVMYAGQAVERGSVYGVFADPKHPYTAGLLRAMPQRSQGSDRLATIPGGPPAPGAAGEACRFAPRCEHAKPACEAAPIPWTDLSQDAGTRCIRYDELLLRSAL